MFGLLLCATAIAADRVGALSGKLHGSKDFRVRTQAALALGASASVRAVKPLCRGLNDVNRTVRAASAAALGKLAKGGTQCVKRRLQKERHSTVKKVLTKVLRRLGQAKPRVIGPQTKYYVAVGKTTNKTPARDADIDRMVRAALDRALGKNSSLVVAPAGESPKQARAILAKHRGLTPVFIWPKVHAKNKSGTLKFKLSFTLFSYPDKAFKGSMAQKLSIRGGRSGDRAALDELLQVAAPRLVSRFLANVDRLK